MDKILVDRATVEPVASEAQAREAALQAVADHIGHQCSVWYGAGARDVEAVLEAAARLGLIPPADSETHRLRDLIGRAYYALSAAEEEAELEYALNKVDEVREMLGAAIKAAEGEKG